ncbi:MAG: hypothetical protein IKD04_09385 [Clostridia bacterium]|nr:hypothetical protein [Clostridia bacterium]
MKKIALMILLLSLAALCGCDHGDDSVRNNTSSPDVSSNSFSYSAEEISDGEAYKTENNDTGEANSSFASNEATSSDTSLNESSESSNDENVSSSFDAEYIEHGMPLS